MYIHIFMYACVELYVYVYIYVYASIVEVCKGRNELLECTLLASELAPAFGAHSLQGHELCSKM